MKLITKHPHASAIMILVVLTMIVFSPWMTTLHPIEGDIVNEYVPFFEHMQISLFKDHEVPLWMHQISSGTPFFAVGDKPVLYPPTYLSLWLFSYALAFNVNVLFHVVLAGVGMYLLMFYLIRKPQYAFISAIVYMLNYHMFRKMHKFWGVAWIPWVILCYYLAINEKDLYKKIGYSALGAVGLAMQFHLGSIEVALFTIVIIVLASLYFLVSAQFTSRVKTLLIVGIVMGACFAGLIAVKLLPNYEFSTMSSRSQGITLEQAKGSHYKWFDFTYKEQREGYLYAPESLIINFTKGCQKGGCSAIGIIASLLVLASLKSWKKKTVLFYWLLALFGATLVTGSFVFEFFYSHVPGFDKLQHAARLGVIVVFACSILAGYGAMYLSEKYTQKWKPQKRHGVYALVILLIIIDIAFVFSYQEVLHNYRFDDFEYKKVPVMQYLSEQYDPSYPFRIKAHETYGRGSVAQYLTMPLGLDIIDGHYGGIWVPEYLNEYLTIAQQYKPKLWGNLNAKYLISTQNLSYPDTELVGEFEPCPECFQAETTGPYLFENKDYLPRAFWTNASILLVGENSMQTGYYLLTHNEFKLRNQIIIIGKHTKISEYKLDELKRYNAIILLTGSVDQTFGLQRYVEQGGTIIPNVLEGEQTATEEDISALLQSFNATQIKELPVSTTTNTMTVPLSDLPEGFIVYNEKMYLFPGWEVYVDNQKIIDGETSRLLRTNMMLSSFYLDKTAKEAVFKYSPDSYELGRNISLATTAILLLFGLFLLWRKTQTKQKKKKHSQA